MTTFSDGVYQYGGVPVGGMFTNGSAYFVKPSTGSNGNTGKRPDKAFSTLAKAQTAATADSNEVVYLISESNSAASTTDYQSSALAWDKDGVHLVGINSGGAIAQRSRIAQLATATNVDNLFTLSADNCRVENIHVFHGVDDATSKGAALVSGDRNHIVNCHFAGIGHDTMDTADNYSLSVTGDENLFERCTIGLDTVARGTAATYEINISGGATRNIFRKCLIISYSEAATFGFLNIPADGIDRFVLFEDCTFLNFGTTMTEAAHIAAGTSPNGNVLLKNCTVVGATDWEANTESGRLYIDGAAPTNNTSGLAVLVEAT
jgi:hypothetical protein